VPQRVRARFISSSKPSVLCNLCLVLPSTPRPLRPRTRCSSWPVHLCSLLLGGHGPRARRYLSISLFCCGMLANKNGDLIHRRIHLSSLYLYLSQKLVALLGGVVRLRRQRWPESCEGLTTSVPPSATSTRTHRIPPTKGPLRPLQGLAASCAVPSVAGCFALLFPDALSPDGGMADRGCALIDRAQCPCGR